MVKTYLNYNSMPLVKSCRVSLVRIVEDEEILYNLLSSNIVINKSYIQDLESTNIEVNNETPV